MILQGTNLIISADGKVLAGAKSCSVDVDAETIKTSSPSDGQWEHSIAGRKSWSVSTGHLMPMTTNVADTIEAVGTCHNGGNMPAARITLNAWNIDVTSGRGLNVMGFEYNSQRGEWQGQSVYEETFDTYDSTEALSQMATFIGLIPSGVLVAIVSFDAYAMNAALASAISTKLGIPLEQIATVDPSRAAFACVGVAGSGGLAMTNTNQGGTAHVKMMLNENHTPITATPLKDAISKVGTTLKIQVQVDGLSSDRVSGNAICKKFSVSGSTGNLMNGSFRFEGTGPLA